jgi:hypothetical protein
LALRAFLSSQSWAGTPRRITPTRYAATRARLENAHAAVEAATVEARRRVRLNKGTPGEGRSLRVSVGR